MAYAAVVFTAGEQPTTAKWNQLGENDARLKDGTAIDSAAITNAKLADGAVTSRKSALTSGKVFLTSDVGVAGASGWLDLVTTSAIAIAGVNRTIEVEAFFCSGAGVGAQANHIFRIMESDNGGTYADVGTPWTTTPPGGTNMSNANIFGSVIGASRTGVAGHSYTYKVQVTTHSGVNYGTVFAGAGSFIKWSVLG